MTIPNSFPQGVMIIAKHRISIIVPSLDACHPQVYAPGAKLPDEVAGYCVEQGWAEPAAAVGIVQNAPAGVVGERAGESIVPAAGLSVAMAGAAAAAMLPPALPSSPPPAPAPSPAPMPRRARLKHAIETTSGEKFRKGAIVEGELADRRGSRRERRRSTRPRW